MSASHPIEPPAAEPKPASTVGSHSYEPSMEEILASIRRIIADDQSLPRAPSEVESREPAPEPSWANERIEPTLVPRVAATSPEPAPLRAHLLRGETVELDFRAMAARQTGLSSVRDVPPKPREAEAAVRPDVPNTAASDLPQSIESIGSSPDATLGLHADRGNEPHSPDTPPHAHAVADAIEAEAHTAPPGIAPLTGGMAHGTIAAPQYAGPGGPEGHDGRDLYEADLQEARTQPAPPPETSLPTAEAEPPYDPIHEPDVQDDYDEPLTGRRDAFDGPAVASGHDHRAPVPSDALFSAATDASVTAAFRTLAATRLADNSEELLDIAREMIRPLLKIWIDDNVPNMVERMVRAEIERVARGGR